VSEHSWCVVDAAWQRGSLGGPGRDVAVSDVTAVSGLTVISIRSGVSDRIRRTSATADSAIRVMMRRSARENV